MSCRAAATLTSYGDEKALFPAVSKVRSSGCVRWGRVKSGSSRKKKWKHARLQGAQRREGVCVGLGCRGAECDFACFLVGRPRDLGANGDGAPPQAHIHLNLEVYRPGSPITKFGSFVTVCNRHLTPRGSLSTLLLRFMGNPLLGPCALLFSSIGAAHLEPQVEEKSFPREVFDGSCTIVTTSSSPLQRYKVPKSVTF